MIKVLQPAHQLSDEELIKRYKKTGNPKYWGILYKKHAHSVFGLCMSYLKNRQDSEDATMEIFEKLSKSLQQYEIEHFESWLFFVSRNFCLKKFKKKIKLHQEDISEINPDLFMENAEEKDHTSEKKLEVLSDAIDGLKDHQKRCIVLFYLENKSYKEIESMTSYSLKDIKSFIQNGKRNLKNNLVKLI